jgi:hypothetical protein
MLKTGIIGIEWGCDDWDFDGKIYIMGMFMGI